MKQFPVSSQVVPISRRPTEVRPEAPRAARRVRRARRGAADSRAAGRSRPGAGSLGEVPKGRGIPTGWMVYFMIFHGQSLYEMIC